MLQSFEIVKVSFYFVGYLERLFYCLYYAHSSQLKKLIRYKVHFSFVARFRNGTKRRWEAYLQLARFTTTIRYAGFSFFICVFCRYKIYYPMNYHFSKFQQTCRSMRMATIFLITREVMCLWVTSVLHQEKNTQYLKGNSHKWERL